jgi:hypothetical protein
MNFLLPILYLYNMINNFDFMQQKYRQTNLFLSYTIIKISINVRIYQTI